MFRSLNPYFSTFIINKRRFHTNNCLFNIYETPKSGYPVVHDEPPITKNKSFLEKLKIAFDLFKSDYKLLAQEIKDMLHLHPTTTIPNEEKVIFKFDGTEKSLKQWIVNYDSVYKEGFSTAKNTTIFLPD